MNGVAAVSGSGLNTPPAAGCGGTGGGEAEGSDAAEAGSCPSWALAMCFGALLRTDPHGMVPKCANQNSSPAVLPQQLPDNEYWDSEPEHDLYSVLVQLRTSLGGSFLNKAGKQDVVKRGGFALAVRSSRDKLALLSDVQLPALCVTRADCQRALAAVDAWLDECRWASPVLYRREAETPLFGGPTASIVFGFLPARRLATGVDYMELQPGAAHASPVAFDPGTAQGKAQLDAAAGRRQQAESACRLWLRARRAIAPHLMVSETAAKEELAGCLRRLRASFAPAVQRRWTSVTANMHRCPHFRVASLCATHQAVAQGLLTAAPGAGAPSTGCNLTQFWNEAASGDANAMIALVNLLVSAEKHMGHALALLAMGDSVRDGNMAMYNMLDAAVKFARQVKSGLERAANTSSAGAASSTGAGS